MAAESTKDRFTEKKRRPGGIWLLAALYLLFGALGGARLGVAWRYQAELAGMGIELPLAWITAYGVLWLLAGVGGALMLLARRGNAGLLDWAAAMVLTVSYWADQFLFTVNPLRAESRGFALLVNAILLLLQVWILSRGQARAHGSGETA